MGKLVSPKVYLVGYTVLDMEGIESYLEDSGNLGFLESIQDARTGGLSDGEILCSMFAKLCYASLTVGKNQNISRVRDIESNIKGCFDSGHGSVFEHCQLNFIIRDCSRIFCYDGDTEVFTCKGWKNITEICQGEEILSFDTSTKMAKWTSVLSMHEFDYEGDMYGWMNSQMISPLMTPDHILWAAWHDKRRARALSCEENIHRYGEKIQFSEALGKRFVIRKNVPWVKSTLGETLKVGRYEYGTSDLFSWLGWMATDGGFDKNRLAKCCITQSKTKNIPVIRKLMDSLFGSRWKMHGPYGNSGLISFTINDSELSQFARDNLGTSKSNRNISKWILDAGTDYLRVFFDSLIQGDGHVHPKNGHICLYCPSELASGQYQVIGAMLGMPANVRVDSRVGQLHEVGGMPCGQTKPSFIIDFSRRGGGTLVKNTDQLQQKYSGKVYCPKTLEGVIYVRRVGHAFWAGNTHELVRHRAGTAFSQTSGRYVRGDKVDIVYDPILDPIKDLVVAFQDEIEVRYKEMVEESGLNDLKDFNLKKKLTSALRRLLPNGQSNEIGFSVNLRSLRHIVQLRTSRYAEWEIRKVFEQVYKIVKEKYPLVFYGALELTVDGILEVSGMKMQPYDKTEE